MITHWVAPHATRGRSEAIIGNWIAKHPAQRDRLVLATKVRFPQGDDPNAVGLSRKHIFASVKRSLAALQTEYIDLLQMHCWDDGTPIEETLRAVAQLIADGKILYFGVR